MNDKNKMALMTVFLIAQNVSAVEMKNFDGIRFVKIEAGCFQMGQDKQTDLKEKESDLQGLSDATTEFMKKIEHLAKYAQANYESGSQESEDHANNANNQGPIDIDAE